MLGLFGVWLMERNIRISGVLMIVAGIGGFIFMTYSYIIPTVLFTVAGLIGLFIRKVPE